MLYLPRGKNLIFPIVASLILTAGYGLTAETKTSVSTGTVSGAIIDKFKSPDLDAKPMARMWFSDAGAGATREGLDMVERHIIGMAEGGMGGIEIAYLADDSKYDNNAARDIGWGSENWKRILKRILKTANSIDTGFKVDITVTAHWPPVVNNIDPNDDEASQEASCAYKKITKNDISSGKVDVPLPNQKTKDSFQAGPAAFLFEDKFISATIAKVASLDRQGNPVFQFSSLKDVSSATAKKTVNDPDKGKKDGGLIYAGYAVGIPDEKYCEANGLKYSDITDKFGPEPVDKNLNGKIDTEGNRKRMADWQYLYETDLSSFKNLIASDGDKLAVGDYVIIGNYYRGTGQVLSGGASVVTYNRCYVMDYFSAGGVQKVFDFWDRNILDDEMLALLKENGRKNGTSIFEDSIEVTMQGPLWTRDLLKNFKDITCYDVSNYVPLLAMKSTGSFDNPEEAARILEDYNLVLGDLYEKEHAARISKWASSFNYTYRAQAYGLSGVDMAGAAMAVDIPEGDNGTSGDGVRTLAAANNMKGSKMMSMEATTFAANINSKWCNIMKVLNANFSDGINRVVLHGTPFARTFNGYESSWPGWNFFKHKTAEDLNGSGFSSWNHRQIWWEDAAIPTGYIARTQAVMQNGHAKVDLAVLVGTDASFSGQGGNSLKGLLDKGYSYNVMSEAILEHKNAVVEKGVLSPDGPAYRALILKNASKISATAMEKLLEFAKNGLPIILYNSSVERVYGANKAGNNDETLKRLFNELTSGQYKNVSKVSAEKDIMDLLSQNRILPAASYDQPGLEVFHRVASEGDYYYFYNDYNKAASSAASAAGASAQAGQGPAGMTGAPTGSGAPGAAQGPGGPEAAGPSGMQGGGPGGPSGQQMQGDPGGAGGPPQSGMPEGAGGQGSGPGGGGQRESEGFKEHDDAGNTITATVTLEGKGAPYILDAWTGEISPIAQYIEKDGKITLDLKVMGRDATIVCIAKDTKGFPSAPAAHATSSSGGKVVIDNDRLVHCAEKAGSYLITTANNSKKTIKVASVPQAINISRGWDLRLQSWGPSEKTAKLSIDNNYDYSVDPSLSEKVEINLKGIDLGEWSDLKVSKELLTRLGVDGMDKVSGIGWYSTIFELPKDWEGNIGAYLRFEHNSDMIAEVRLNGRLIGRVNQMTDTKDVSGFLRQGENTIEIKLDTTLQNRDPAAIEKTTYGLSSVTLVPYYQSVL